jgi:hypothetical protein
MLDDEIEVFVTVAGSAEFETLELTDPMGFCGGGASAAMVAAAAAMVAAAAALASSMKRSWK